MKKSFSKYPHNIGSTLGNRTFKKYRAKTMDYSTCLVLVLSHIDLTCLLLDIFETTFLPYTVFPEDQDEQES